MRHVNHVVLDEADTLLDDSFNEKLCHFLRKFQVSILHTLSVLSCCGLFKDTVKLLN
jgi:superfamily II DNA/RNA helicase